MADEPEDLCDDAEALAYEIVTAPDDYACVRAMREIRPDLPQGFARRVCELRRWLVSEGLPALQRIEHERLTRQLAHKDDLIRRLIEDLKSKENP